MDHGVPFLQRTDIAVAVFLDVADPFRSRARRVDRCDIRDARLDGILSEIAVIMNTVFADRRVDDQLDLAVCDQVNNVGSSFVELLDALCVNAGLLDQIAGAACGQDLETAVIKDLSDFRNFRLILLVDGDQASVGSVALAPSCALK